MYSHLKVFGSCGYRSNSRCRVEVLGGPWGRTDGGEREGTGPKLPTSNQCGKEHDLGFP